MKAFPSNYTNADNTGMDLRDYIAAAVLPNIIVEWPNTSFVGAAELAYEYAEAMMEYRKPSEEVST